MQTTRHKCFILKNYQANLSLARHCSLLGSGHVFRTISNNNAEVTREEAIEAEK